MLNIRDTSRPFRRKPVVLCILDGWGKRASSAGNAIAIAETPNWDRFIRGCPSSQLEASSGNVGLPEGQMGNSEVGHMNLGAGRIVMQDLPRIGKALHDGSLAANAVLAGMIEKLRGSGGVCHMMGLLSPGGVHSHQDHMVALIRIIAGAGIPVALHAFLDGRDTPPKSAVGFMEDVLAQVEGVEGFTVGTVSGRYYGMDRDKRWDRVKKAFDAICDAQGKDSDKGPIGAILDSYGADLTDEFMLPTVMPGYQGMCDGDSVLMANFRTDRAREILLALCDPSFDGFQRSRLLNFAACIGMTEYSALHNRFMDTIFPSQELTGLLGELASQAGRTQLRIAETEKYAHVTSFFNCGREEPYEGEERILVASPKVATYDLQPEMSAIEVTNKLVQALQSGRFDMVIANYANCDMVGHTGILDAAVKAASTVDACLGRLDAAVAEAGGVMLVTADHGNCEQMIDLDTSQPHTAHTLNPVPLVLVGAPNWVRGLRDGSLADIAPTLLRLLELDQPQKMTGRSLIVENGQRAAAAQ